MIKKLFRWVFKSELDTLQVERESIKKYVDLMESRYTSIYNRYNELQSRYDHLSKILGGVDLSVDVHEDSYSPSWAVISIQGQKMDYIKFIDLGKDDIYAIQSYLRQFERVSSNVKVDATPRVAQYLIPKNRRYGYQ